MRVLSLGDIHGFDTWKSPLNYWRPEETSDVDQFDKIIFVGDYVDEFILTDAQILKNFEEIIELKKKYPEKVELLLGNHDVQYIYPTGNKCTGFRESMFFQLSMLFQENKKLFKIAHQEQNYLWTHAGIHRGFWSDQIMNKKYVIRHGEEMEHLEIDHSQSVADILNFCWETQHEPIFHCGWARGGNKKVGGPLWADFNETYKKPLDGYHQIIGHTHKSELKHYENYKDKNTSTTYIDCMNIEYDKYYIIEI